ncbi:fatty acyl-CoA reductase wat-like [Uranotaenia lowii]|uniref:fatty acyl-CoA reductase wat-like n=1 Tax=Uranotaenia lowii TaxID=190385 RepID=UPI00247A6B8D|nr:fatty acyl-CoA reductase wat-like [Uranotaenia lowii]
MLEQIFTADDQKRRDPSQSVNSPMRQFFRGKTVFLTGGTGFLGKLFIEKLLKCDVKELILLIRPKRGRTSRERLQRQFERETVYQNYSQNPNSYWTRIRVIDGALQYTELNLPEIDIEYLKNNVEIVIHSAADVNLDTSIQNAIKTNVFGAQELLKIALGMKKLISFLYISTAYSNCIQEEIFERYYDVHIQPTELVKIADTLQEEDMDTLSRKIIHPWPNTYTFAKATAENVFREYCNRLPIVLIRPSIVIATVDDPIEGWTDNVYGLNGVISGVGSGVLRILLIDNQYHSDIIPADLVVNSSLAAIWYSTTQQVGVPAEEKVFNCVSRVDNPFTYEKVCQYCMECKFICPAIKTLWFPRYNHTKSKTVYYFLNILYHFIPALFFDLLARIMGEKPRVVFLYRKIQQFTDVLQFFTNNQWWFRNENMRKVYDSMSVEDKEFFPSDVKKIDWHDFFYIYVMGLRKYVMKENLENLKEAKRKMVLLCIMHYTLLTVLYLLAAWALVVVFRSDSVQSTIAWGREVLPF